mmetsp:Transcript_32922/g.97156  ORF Transcript_32922/g.97156 Transcript_32922/m.97156 type:complete len:206 (+) Transcript_32922:571-1188(+)
MGLHVAVERKRRVVLVEVEGQPTRGKRPLRCFSGRTFCNGRHSTCMCQSLLALFLMFLLSALEEGDVHRVVQTQHVGVKLHLFNVHAQLFRHCVGTTTARTAWSGTIGAFTTRPTCSSSCVARPVFRQHVFPAHEKVDCALVVLGRGTVRASLVVQGAEGQMMTSGGDELFGECEQEGLDLRLSFVRLRLWCLCLLLLGGGEGSR